MRTVVTAARVLAGPDLVPEEPGFLVIEGDRIEAVGSGRVAGDAEVDARGLTLLPGFIDAHVHIGLADPPRVLAGGVTTVRDLGWPSDRIFPIVEASRSADWNGPSVIAAGPILTARGGYPTGAGWAPPGTGLEVQGADDAPGAVEAVARMGGVVVKVAVNSAAGPTFDVPTLAAIVDAAHDRGMKTTGHVHSLSDLETSLAAGLDELAHVPLGSDPVPAELIRALVEAGVVMVPTLAITSGAGRRRALATTHDFVNAGGIVVYGTDLGNEGPRPGIDATEIGAMAAAGLSPEAIARSATAGAADWLGLGDRGALAPGRRPDVIAVAGDPLEDAVALTDVRMVWRAGTRI